MNPSDKLLLQALQRGEPHACDEMVQQFSTKIYNAALRITGHPNEAEEVLQETFINACRGVESFEGRSSLLTWLYRIATNNGLMRLRRKETPTVSLNESSEDDIPQATPYEIKDWQWNPEALLLTDELRQAMNDAVEDLPELLQMTFILRDIEELSTRETAEILGITTRSVKVRLHRARLFLRTRLAEYFTQYEAEATQ